MSHYFYDPSCGYFKSNARVNLSLEEMRFEYYEEVNARKRMRNKHNRLIDVDESCCKTSNSFDKIRILNDNFINQRFKRQYDSDYEDLFLCKKVKLAENLTNQYLDDEMDLLPETVSTEHKENSVFKRKNNFDSAEILHIKKINLDQSNRCLDDELDILSSSIVKSSKKSKLHKSQKFVKSKILQSAENEKKLINTIIEIRKLGNEMVKIGDYSSAFDKYTESLNLSRGKYLQLTSMNYSNRAFSLMKLNRYSEALQDCDAAILNNLQCDEKTKLRRIKCFIELKRFQEAKADVMNLKSESCNEECDQLLTIINDKQRYLDLVATGQQSENREDFSTAISCYSEAMKIDDNSTELLMCRAKCFFELEKYRESLNDLNEALRLNPLNFQPMHNRIGCLLKLERFHEAIRCAEELNKFYPSEQNQNLLRTTITAEKIANKRNYYEILKVGRNASSSEITKQYRKMAVLFHPDKIVDGDSKVRAQHEEKFKQLQIIYKTLSDSSRRKIYDLELMSRF